MAEYDQQFGHIATGTAEQNDAWHAVLVRLFDEYPAHISSWYLAARFKKKLGNSKTLMMATGWRTHALKTARGPEVAVGDSYYNACETGVPAHELTTAFMMIFGAQPQKVKP